MDKGDQVKIELVTKEILEGVIHKIYEGDNYYRYSESQNAMACFYDLCATKK